MNREYIQQILINQKLNLDQIDTSAPTAEIFLKSQANAVINLITDLEPMYGQIAKKDIETLWLKYYKERGEWQHSDTYGGSSSLEIEKQKIVFEVRLLQDQHWKICETLQNCIDQGELLR